MSAPSRKGCDLQEEWRRRESNPRPRTHREERLQACPALPIRPPAGAQATYRRASHPLKSRFGRLALPRRRARWLTPLPDPRAETGATRCLEARQRVRVRYPHLLGFPVVLRGQPGTSACSSSGEPTTSKPDRPRMFRMNCSRAAPDQRLRSLSARSICRRASRSARSRRLSRCSFPRATASSTFTFPSLK
jgi:hypothetical protein